MHTQSTAATEGPSVLIMMFSTQGCFCSEPSTLFRVHTLPAHVGLEQRPCRGQIREADLLQLWPCNHGTFRGALRGKDNDFRRFQHPKNWNIGQEEQVSMMASFRKISECCFCTITLLKIIIRSAWEADYSSVLSYLSHACLAFIVFPMMHSD